MRISDWSSDVCSSDLLSLSYAGSFTQSDNYKGGGRDGTVRSTEYKKTDHALSLAAQTDIGLFELRGGYHFSPYEGFPNQYMDMRSEEHTSELQSLMRISYAVFCLHNNTEIVRVTVNNTEYAPASPRI